MTHLYQLSDQYHFLAQSLENEEVQEEELREQLNTIKAQFEDKAENIGKLVLSLAGEVTTLNAEEERLNSRKQSLQKKIDWLKSYLLQEMTSAKIPKIKHALITISLRDNPPSVNVLNQDDIPLEYRRIIPETWQPDKRLILYHFKDTGEIISGTEMITDKKTLVIK